MIKVWVNGQTNMSSGYLITKGATFAVTPWKNKGTIFETEKAAEKFMSMYKIKNDTHVLLGVITGYTVNC